MKKIILLSLALVASFGFGFAFKSIVTSHANDDPKIKRVTGIGGIFFKCKDPKKVREWYQKHLGLNTLQYGAVFEWRQGADTTKKGLSQWSPFGDKTKYFEPSTKDFMINYLLQFFEELLQQ